MIARTDERCRCDGRVHARGSGLLIAGHRLYVNDRQWGHVRTARTLVKHFTGARHLVPATSPDVQAIDKHSFLWTVAEL